MARIETEEERMGGRACSVVVTGAARGLGWAVLERLVEEGWYGVGLDRDVAPAAEAIERLGDGGTVLQGDTTNHDDLQRALDAAVAEAPLAGWVNNAAAVHLGNLHDPVESEVEAVLRVNVHGTFWATSVAVRQFLAQASEGSIVNLSSIHARAGFSNWAAYATSKGAIEALTRYTAMEYGPVGVRANAIAPGVVMGPSVSEYLDQTDDPQAALDALQEQPLRRLGQPSDVADMASWLLSSASAYVSGQCIGLDGGWSAVRSAQPTHPDLVAVEGRS